MSHYSGEADRIREDVTGRYTDADRRVADNYELNEERWAAQRGNAHADQIEQTVAERQHRMQDVARKLKGDSVSDQEALASGALTVEEYLQRSAAIDAQIGAMERHLAGLVSSADQIAAIRTDPLAWEDDLYAKWGKVLRRTRPTVDDWIQEARMTRLTKDRTKRR